MEEQIVTLIAQVGFPIAITVWLLTTQGRAIERNTAAVNGFLEYLKEKDLREAMNPKKK
jgi:hypothetical protein